MLTRTPGCAAGIIVSAMNDRFAGKLKTCIILLYSLATLGFVVFGMQVLGMGDGGASSNHTHPTGSGTGCGVGHGVFGPGDECVTAIVRVDGMPLRCTMAGMG